MIQAIMSPLLVFVKKGEFDVILDDYDVSQYETASDAVLDTARIQAENVLLSVLDEYGAEYDGVEIICNITDDGVINIERARIYVREVEGDDIKNYVKQKTGLDTELLSQEDGER